MSTRLTDDLETNLISTIAHDLKTPLSAIKGFIDLVQHSGPLTERQAHFCNRALLGLQRMEDMINNMSDFGRIVADTPLQLSECDLPEIIRKILELIEESILEQTIAIKIQNDLPDTIIADKGLIRQLLSNLITNGVKYNRPGGSLHIHLYPKIGFIQVDIQDTGMGIPAEDQEHIFDRFFRAENTEDTNIAGTGLGLSISKAIVEKHGGAIWFESVLDTGTTFSFTLPLHDNSHQNNTHQAASLIQFRDTSTEPIDDVDDDIQESKESPDTDSSYDDV